jgi:ankyrin repeat protein
MAKAKRKTLPKNFDELLQAGDTEAIKAVFDTCDVNAHGGSFKRAALAFNDLPDDVSRWLIGQGADISATDSYGETPLHSRAGHWKGKIGILLEEGADVHCTDSRGETPLHKAASVGNVQTARALLEHGARIDALNRDGLSPLALALQRCSNSKIRQIAEVAELLLEAQPSRPAGVRSIFFCGCSKANKRKTTGFPPRCVDLSSASARTLSSIAATSIRKAWTPQALH